MAECRGLITSNQEDVLSLIEKIGLGNGVLILCDDTRYLEKCTGVLYVSLFGSRGKLEISKSVRNYPMDLIIENGLCESVLGIMESMENCSTITLIVDIDVLDPAFGGSGTPGGLSSSEFLFVLKKIGMMRKLTQWVIAGDLENALVKTAVDLLPIVSA